MTNTEHLKNSKYETLVEEINKCITDFKEENENTEFDINLVVGLWHYNDSKLWELFVNVVALIKKEKQPFLYVPYLIKDIKLAECRVDDNFFYNIGIIQKEGKKIHKFLQKKYSDCKNYHTESHNLLTKIKKNNIKNFS